MKLFWFIFIYICVSNNNNLLHKEVMPESLFRDMTFMLSLYLFVMSEKCLMHYVTEGLYITWSCRYSILTVTLLRMLAWFLVAKIQSGPIVSSIICIPGPGELLISLRVVSCLHTRTRWAIDLIMCSVILQLIIPNFKEVDAWFVPHQYIVWLK